jgi:hypothetical protein
MQALRTHVGVGSAIWLPLGGALCGDSKFAAAADVGSCFYVHP